MNRRVAGYGREMWGVNRRGRRDTQRNMGDELLSLWSTAEKYEIKSLVNNCLEHFTVKKLAGGINRRDCRDTQRNVGDEPQSCGVRQRNVGDEPQRTQREVGDEPQSLRGIAEKCGE